MFTRTLARVAGTAAVAACLLAPAAAQAAPAKHPHATAHRAKAASKARVVAASADCANADVMPTAANLREVADAIVCLHNEIRAERGLATLKVNVRLNRAAVGHSDDMVAAGYFEHDAPNGATFVDRLLKAGYCKRSQGWTLGENLAWGTDTLATPRALMTSWMNSPAHKANIVKRAYREIGIGITLGNPTDATQGVTVDAEFGVVAR